MCGRRFAGRGGWGHHGGSVHYFGRDVRKMSPRGQVVAAGSVIAPVALGALLVVSFVPGMFWLVFAFGWMAFPAFGLLARGLAGMSEARPERAAAGSTAAKSGERELLEALERHGELTAARAAMETSLSVAGADEMLRKLAEGGHLEVRARGGGLHYALWDGGSRRRESRFGLVEIRKGAS